MLRKTVIATLLPLLFAACAREPELPEPARLVRTETVGAEVAATEATYSGEIRARRVNALGFLVSGRVQRRLVEVGDSVVAGQPLLALDPSDTELNLRAFRAQLDSARSQYRQAKLDFERFEKLAQRKFVGQSELERQRLSLHTTSESLNAAEANYRAAQNQAAYATLKATAAGVVTAIDVEAGNVVASGQAVIHIAEDGEREIVISVPEARVAELRSATTLGIELWAQPQRRYQGRLRELAPDTDDITRTYAARISVVDADARVGLGMTAKVVVEVPASERQYRLPLTALYDVDGAPQVWIVDRASSSVAARAVTLGQAQNDGVLILDGIAAGDVVVTAGVHLLHAGQKVRTASANPSVES